MISQERMFIREEEINMIADSDTDSNAQFDWFNGPTLTCSQDDSSQHDGDNQGSCCRYPHRIFD